MTGQLWVHLITADGHIVGAAECTAVFERTKRSRTQAGANAVAYGGHPKQTAVIAELSKAFGELTEAMGATRWLIGERAQVRHDADGQYRSVHEAEPTAQLSGRPTGPSRSTEAQSAR